jgi:hypothetical protein
MKCKICDQESKNLLALSSHIQFKHDNKSKEYYDSYMMKKHEGFCKICGRPTKYWGFSKGYAEYCSKECMKSDYSEKKKADNPMKKQSAKDNQRKTNQERYGVNSTMQLRSVLNKRSESNMKKYGIVNVSQIKEVMDKANKSRSETCMKEHGVPHYFMLEWVKAKMRKTFFEKYGSESCMHNEEVFLKNQKSGCHAPSFNETLYYRGSYELDFLEKYYNKFEIKQGLSFSYEFDNKNCKYFSDFYLPPLNLIVEIKNSWAAERFKEKIDAKKAAVIAAGYNFIIIINKDYSGFQKLLE